MWKSYIEYLDEAVLDGFYNTVHCSLTYFLSNTEKDPDTPPLLECKLELQAPDTVFVPSLEQVRFDASLSYI